MKDKDRQRLRAAAFLAGVAAADGEPLASDILDTHDWGTFLLAKEMDPSTYLGPAWVPFSLWSAYESGAAGAQKDCVHKLIFAAGAREVWAAIESTYARPNSVAISLPVELAMARDIWKATAKRTPSKHREHLLSLKAKAIALASEIEQIESLDALTTGERFDFMRLYDAQEKEIVYHNVSAFMLRHRPSWVDEKGIEGKTFGEYIAPEDPDLPESPLNLSQASREAGEIWELLLGDDETWPGIVPSPSAMLRRLATYFEGESSKPPMQRPAFENAERNFISRHLCRYFRDSCGFASPSIVSRIVCMFYQQGITENEVSQMIKQLPGGNMPQWSETSP